MAVTEMRHPRWITWSLLPIALIAGAISIPLGDMAFICLKYGQRAYVTEGLRFVKHKPYTLSTGEVLSQDVGSLAWLVSTAIWLLLIFATVIALTRLSALFSRT